MITRLKHVKVYDLQNNLIGEFLTKQEAADYYCITHYAVKKAIEKNCCVDEKYYIRSEGSRFMLNIQKESLNCSRCGVKICDKNKYKINPKVSKYISGMCKSCFINAKFCALHYESKELEILSSKRSQNISKRMWQLKNPQKQKGIRIQDKKNQKKKVKEFDEHYMKVLICRESKLNLKVEDIPQKLIELKKKELVIKRNLKNQGIWVR